jgi:hypothetical protein
MGMLTNQSVTERVMSRHLRHGENIDELIEGYL